MKFITNNRLLKKILLLILLFLCILTMLNMFQLPYFGEKICASTHIINITNAENNILVCLKYRQNTWKINLKDFIKSSENFEIQNKYNMWGRNGNLNNAKFAIDGIVKMGISYEKAFEFVYFGMNKSIDNIIKLIDIEPKNSKIVFTPNFSKKFNITLEKIGYKVKKERLYKQIYNYVFFNNTNTIEITAEQVLPTITKEDNLKATKLLSSFSTSINSSSNERKHNVKKALSEFNGKVIKPNEEVSFNNTVGKRSEKNGYKTAHIIINELFVDGVGGGVCQSSSTLYNALLLADNIKIIEANRHSMPVSYVQLGFDAMVSYGSSDLKFQNVSTNNLYIATYTKKDRVFVDIYGKPNEIQYCKKRRTEIIKSFDEKDTKKIIDYEGKYANKVKYIGETFVLKTPQKGYEVQTYLDYYIDDELKGSCPIRHTTYPSQGGIIVEGAIEDSEQI